MKWKQPPLNKIYEALGAIGDGRIEIDGNSTKVYSSSRNKFYEVIFDPETNTISSNDNASFFAGYLGYPAIALLLAQGLVQFDLQLPRYLGGFKWKDINQKFKNDFEKTDAFIDSEIIKQYHVDLEDFHGQLEQIRTSIMELGLNKPAHLARPPKGY